MIRNYLTAAFGLVALIGIAGCDDDAPRNRTKDPIRTRAPRGAISKSDAIAGSCIDDEGLGLCGEQGIGNCFCDDACAMFGDCCGDFDDACGAPTEFGEVCFNGEDDNNNGRTDCDDPSCVDDPSCSAPDTAASCEGICGQQHGSGCWCDETCSDHGDCCIDVGLICAPPEFGEVCFNGEDDNDNALVDCDDPGCHAECE